MSEEIERKMLEKLEDIEDILDDIKELNEPATHDVDCFKDWRGY